MLIHDIHSIPGFGHTVLLYLRLLVGLSFGWLIFQWHRWKTFFLENTARRWPQVEAAILYGSVSPVANTRIFEVVLIYSYYVDEYREGKYFRDFMTQSQADSFMRNMLGKRLLIRYKPSNPKITVINRSAIDELEALLRKT